MLGRWLQKKSCKYWQHGSLERLLFLLLQEIRAEDIDMYVGAYSSDSSIYLARILTDLKVPQISYAATSNTLENELIYPYFFRTVPADDKQVRLLCQVFVFKRELIEL